MKKKYIFASSSNYSIIDSEFEALRKQPLNLVFVPSSKEEYPFRLAQEEEILKKLNLNLSHVTSLTHDVKDWITPIKKADILYLHGGNPLVFKEYLIEKQVIDLIGNFSGIIIGISAGAMLMSQHIILTPSNDEYIDFICESAFGFGEVNIFPHMNYNEIVVSKLTNRDGEMRIRDLRQLSFQQPIDLLADNHFIIVEEGKTKYVGDYFYRIDKGKIMSLINNQWVTLNYIENDYDQSLEVSKFDRLFSSMEDALQSGMIHRFKLEKKFRLFGFFEEIQLSQQLDLEELKTYVLQHPEFKFATLSYQKFGSRVLERFTFRTRYLKFFEMLKVYPKIVTFSKLKDYDKISKRS